MRVRRDDGEAGFTLIEVITAVAVISVVLVASTTFFIKSMVTIDMQGVRQAAIQVASDGMEQLRAVPGAQALQWITDHQTPADVSVNGFDYQRSFGCNDVKDGAIVPSAGLCVGDFLFIQPKVLVTWTDKGCSGVCTYSATTRISTSAVEPVFGVS